MMMCRRVVAARRQQHRTTSRLEENKAEKTTLFVGTAKTSNQRGGSEIQCYLQPKKLQATTAHIYLIAHGANGASRAAESGPNTTDAMESPQFPELVLITST